VRFGLRLMKVTFSVVTVSLVSTRFFPERAPTECFFLSFSGFGSNFPPVQLNMADRVSPGRFVCLPSPKFFFLEATPVNTWRRDSVGSSDSPLANGSSLLYGEPKHFLFFSRFNPFRCRSPDRPIRTQKTVGSVSPKRRGPFFSLSGTYCS